MNEKLGVDPPPSSTTPTSSRQLFCNLRQVHPYGETTSLLRTHAYYDMSYHNVKLISYYKITVYKRWVWCGFSFIPRLTFFNGSCLRWSFGWKFFFSSNTTRMSVRTLHYRSDPQGRSWWRFLYSKYRLLFNFKCWLFFQGWDTCEIEINKWITHFLWNYYIWLQFFFNITTTVILTKILSILVS